MPPFLPRLSSGWGSLSFHLRARCDSPRNDCVGSLLDVRSLSQTSPIRGILPTNQLHPRVQRRSPPNSILEVV